MLLAVVPLLIFGVIAVVVFIGVRRTKAAGRSTHTWRIVALVAFLAFVAYVLVGNAILRAGQ